MKNKAKQILVFTMMVLGATGAWAQSAPTKQSNGTWKFTMPAGNRTLRTTWKQEIGLAWKIGEDVVSSVSGYLGFENAVMFPELYFMNSDIAGQFLTHGRYGSSEPTVATIDNNGNVNFVSSGETVIYAVYNDDEYYDSVYYTLTVENSVTVCLYDEPDDIIVGEVSLLGDNIHSEDDHCYYVIPGDVTVQAVPVERYYMQKWVLGEDENTHETYVYGNDTVNTIFHITQDTAITAYFAPKPTMTLVADDNGTVEIEGATRTSPWTTKIFDYCYGINVNYSFPVAESQNPYSISGFGHPLNQYKSWNGPWKVEYVGEYTTDESSEFGQTGVQIIQQTYGNNIHSFPKFRLYQWKIIYNNDDEEIYNDYDYNSPIEGTIFAYANEDNPAKHAAFFVTTSELRPDTVYTFILTDSTLSNTSELQITFDKDLSTGLDTIVNATTTNLPDGVMDGNAANEYIVDYDTNVTVKATANSLHFVSGWEDELHHTLATASYSNYSVTSPDNKFPANSSLTLTVTGDTTAKALFGINDYVVSASVADGQSERGTVQIAYTDGDNQPQTMATTATVTSVEATALGGSQSTVTATPATGYHFTNWNGNVTTNPCTTSVAASYTVSFDTNAYVLTVLSDNTTMGGVNGGTDNAKHFRQYTISATPNPGYHFDHWNDNNTNNPRTVTLTEATTYTAYFAENPTLTLVADGEGTVTVEGAQRLIDLSTLTANYTAQDGDILTGTLDVANYPVKISVADGATVTLAGMNISGVNESIYWAGITCLGDATIVLADGSTNIVKGFHYYWPGIEVGPTGTTLTIKGTGRLDASSNGTATSIGSVVNDPCGNITILNGNINATCGNGGAGIGASPSGSCGDITISGGSINVISGSGSYAPGIGAGLNSTCGNITINGGIINASGAGDGAGIGTGQNGHCGDITITNGVTSVTASKGTGTTNPAQDAIGRSVGKSVSCGTITIGGTVYWGLTSNPNEEATYVYKNDGANYLTQSTLTYNGNGNGTGTGSGSDPVSFNILTTDNPNVYSVYPGTEVTVTATPATNHYMKNWNNEEDLNSNVPVNKDVTVNANTTITAHFAQKPTLMLAVNDANMGSVDVQKEGNNLPANVKQIGSTSSYYVDYGTEVTVNATANPLHFVSGWEDELQHTLATATYSNYAVTNPANKFPALSSLTFTVTGDTTAKALFGINDYVVSASVAEGQSERGTVQIAYTDGDNQPQTMATTATVTSVEATALGGSQSTVTATPATGYHFTNWNGNVTTNPCTTSVAASYTASFDTNAYVLTVLSDNTTMGGVNGGTDNAKHFREYTISATPNPGYHFDHWNDNNTDNPRIVTLTENTTYTAYFAENPTLTLVADGNGTVTLATLPDGVLSIVNDNPQSGSESYSVPPGTQVTVTATPAEHHYMQKWTVGNNVNTKNSNAAVDTTFIVTETMTLTATFAAKPTLTLVADPTDGGRVEIDGANGRTEPWETKIFEYCYSCNADGTYHPRNNNNEWTPVHVNSNDETPQGPWKVEYVGDYSYPDNTYNFDADGINALRTLVYELDNSQPIPLFRLYLKNNNDYQHAAYGTVCAYVNNNTSGHAAFFQDAEGRFFFLTDAAVQSDNPHITYTEDLKDGVPTIVGATTTNLPNGVVEGNNANEYIVDYGTEVAAKALPNTGYHLASWNPVHNLNDDDTAHVTVTSNTTLTANFAINTYTVTIVSNNESFGTVSQGSVINVPYGTNITVDGNTLSVNGTTVTATPATNTAQYTYDFSNWSDVPQTVIGNVTITANFTQTLNTYTVTIVPNEGAYGTVNPTSVLNVPYGTTITSSGNTLSVNGTTVTATPATNTAQYTYAFSNWSDVPLTVMGNVTITANFTRTLNTYTVTLVANEGAYGTVNPTSVLNVPYGTTITSSGNTLSVNTATATTVTATPTTNTAQYTYAFSNWSDVPQTVMGNVTITANFTQTLNTYTVTLVANEGAYGTVNPTSVLNVPYGTAVTTSGNTLSVNGTTVTATPATNTAQYTYAFSDWSDVPQSVTGNVTITANFTQTLNSYTVTIVANNDAYGTVNPTSVASVPYGTTITSSGNTLSVNGTTVTATPAMNTEQYTYAFSNWSDVPLTVMGNVTITANFTRTLNTYTVTIVPNNGTYGTVSQGSVLNVPYGTTITSSGNTLSVNGTTVTATPATNTAQYTYAFSNWSDVPQNVTGNVTIKANFTQTLNTYTVTLVPNNGTYGTVSQGSVLNVPYGTAVTTSGNTLSVNGTTVTATPATNTAQYTYDFSNWSDVPQNVTGNVTIKANFTRTLNTYTVTLVANEGAYGTVNPTSVLNVPYGTAVTTSGNTLSVNGTTVTATPATNTAQYTYAFSDWSDVPQSVTGNVTITANFTRTLNTYTVTIVPNNGTYGTVSQGSVLNVPYGTAVTTSGNTLSVNGTTVTATPATNTAQYTYDFSNWSDVPQNVTGNVTIKANFTQTLNTYTVTVVSNNESYGTVNPTSVLNVPYGTAVTTSGNTLSVNGTTVTATSATNTAQYTYAFSDWSNVPLTVTGDVTIKANFTQTLNTYTVTIVSNNESFGTVSQGSVLNVPYGTTITSSGNTLSVNTATATTVTATPATNTAQYTYAFSNWSDVPQNVMGNVTITANFTRTLNTYTLTLATNGSGSVSLPNPLPDGVTGSNGTYTVNHGTQVTVTATPATHHYMQKWDDEDPINSNVPVNKTVTVTENTTLTAYFAQKPILTLSTNPSDPIRGYVTIAGTTLPNYVAQIGTSSSYYVDYDSSVTVKATPIDHYHLASWNNTSGNALQQVVTMTADMEITGVFAIDTFTLTLKTNDIAMGKAEVTNHSDNPAIVSHDPDANGTRTYKVNYGAEVIIKAFPKDHYHLESWSNGATVNPEDTIHVIVTDNSTITANFAINTYTISASVNPTEGGTVSGAGSYTHGASCTLTATPATGYHFVNWTDGNEVVSTNATYAFTVNGTRSLVANFSLNTYAITANANPTEGGTVTGGDTYHHGNNVTLTATANTGYTFTNWTKDNAVVSTNATYSFTATEAANYVANFTLNSYTITVTANPTAGGTLTGAGSYNHGTICTLTATANEGYAFSKWTENGDEVSTDATYSFTVTGARNLVAVFDTLTYSIAVTADPAEGGTITGTGIYKHFETCTLTATPTTGYHFVNWTENDTVVANAGAEYTFTVTGARNLMANFAINTYTLTLAADGDGTVTLDGLNIETFNNLHSGQSDYTGENIKLHVDNPLDGGFQIWHNNFMIYYYYTATITSLNGENITKVELTRGSTSCYQGFYNDLDRLTVNQGTLSVDGDMATITGINATSLTIGAQLQTDIRIGKVKVYYGTPPEGITEYTENNAIVENKYHVTHGTELTVKAAAAPLHHVAGWSDEELHNLSDLATYSNYAVTNPNKFPAKSSIHVTVTGDTTMMATFYLNSYEVNAAVANGQSERGTVQVAYTDANNQPQTIATTATVTSVQATALGGSTTTVTATPNYGYVFSNWNDNVTDNPRTTIEAANYTANFDFDQFTVTAIVANGQDAMGTASGTATVNYLSNVTLTAQPANGHHFVNWTEADTIYSTNATIEVQALSNRTLTANFAVTPAELAWSAEEFTGYVAIDFNNWKPTLTNPHSVNVHYGCVEGNDPDNGGIAVDATTGIIGNETNFGHATLKSGTFHIYAVHETDQNYYYDSVVYTLHVLPSAFVGLTPNIASAGTLSMPNATNVPTLTHHYATVANLPTVMLALNESVNILAEPATGYHFNHWQIPLVPQEETTTAAYTYQFTIPVTVDFQINLLTRTLRAVFDTNTYALNVESANLEMGSGNGSTTAKHFLDYEISAMPNTGYHFVQWNDGITVNPRTVTLTSDSTFTATFAPDTFTITYMDGDVELNVDTFYYLQPITDYTVSKVGWDFLGWNPAVPEVMPAENLTVYAQWYRICDPVTDIDNNTYPSVNINNKCWMAANLRTTHYADGRDITNLYEYTSFLYPSTAENVSIYGRLYDWYDAMDATRPTKAAQVQGICPAGWRMPTQEDFAALDTTDLLNMRSTNFWVVNDGNNSTGLDMRGSGLYNIDDARYEELLCKAYFWTANGTSATEAHCREASYFCNTFLDLIRNKENAFSVRCVKD